MSVAVLVAMIPAGIIAIKTIADIQRVKSGARTAGSLEVLSYPGTTLELSVIEKCIVAKQRVLVICVYTVCLHVTGPWLALWHR